MPCLRRIYELRRRLSSTHVIIYEMDPESHENEKVERLRRAMYSRSLSPKLTARPRHTMDSESSSVGEDWKRQQNEEEFTGAIIAPKTLRGGKNTLRWLLIAAIVFFVGAATFFGYYFTIGGGSRLAAPGNVNLLISGPPSVAGGEMTELHVSISNQNRAALQLADLILTYPPGTRIPGTAPLDVPSQRISLGNIPSGQVRQIPIRAVFSGAEGNHASIKAELEYRLVGSSAVFVASGNHELVFSSSPILIAIDGNTETVSGQPVQLTMTVNSNAAAPIKDVLLSVGYPFGFKFSGSDPKQSFAGVWELGDITPGKSVRVVVRGTLSGEPKDERVFRARIGTRKTQDSQNIDTPLADNSLKMTISEPFLGLSVSTNNVPGPGVVVKPGDTVNISVSWQNNLPTPITDAVIVARLSGVEIDGEKVRTNDGFYRSSDNAVLWDKTTTGGALSNLSYGSQGVVSFSFIMPDSAALQAIKNPHLTITVNAAGKRLSETDVPETLQSTASQTIKVASNLQVSAQGFYYQNPFGSVGPLPPKAGTETTYAIALGITNTTSKIINAKLTATLPNYVRWLGMYIPSGENVAFNKTDSTVTWSVGDIESGAGVDGAPARQIAFAVGLTPSTSQIGEKPALLRSISLTGIDSSTGETVSPGANDVTTNILGDQGFSSSYSTVVR